MVSSHRLAFPDRRKDKKKKGGGKGGREGERKEEIKEERRERDRERGRFSLCSSGTDFLCVVLAPQELAL